MLNILSLLLGLTAWGLGFGAAARRSHSLSFFSFAFCGTALVLQFFEVGGRVTACDWCGLMDTVPALTMAATVLLTVTVALNLIALLRMKTSK